jgi:hypothetical protein
MIHAWLFPLYMLPSPIDCRLQVGLHHATICVLGLLTPHSVHPLQSLLCDPNPNSPANSEAARMFSENKREYNRKVREIVEQSWTAD